MRVTPFLFLICALSLHPARAQFAAKEAPSTPIRYSRDVPQSVLKRMPRGAKSLFWGKFSPKQGSGLMAIHLFALRPKAEFANRGRNTTYHFALDILAQKRTKWNRLNRVPVTFLSFIWGPVLISAKLFWLDKEETQPLLNLESFVKGDTGDQPPIGDALFLSFTQRWTAISAPQRLYFGASNNGLTTYRIQLTGSGFLQIWRDDGSMNIGNDAQGNDVRAITIFRWNGKKFVVTPQTRQMLAPYEKEWLP